MSIPHGVARNSFPSPSEEELADVITLDDFLIEKKESTYMLEVDSDEMSGAHVIRGDILLVERTEKPRDGALVVAEVDDALMIKIIRIQKNSMWLENGSAPPLKIVPTDQLKIIGVVKVVIRKLS